MKAIGPLVGYVMRETKGAPTAARSRDDPRALGAG